jgi:hypothetical protein
VQPGDAVTISASGAVSMGGGWAPGPPEGLAKTCKKIGFPAPNLRCWSLIGRVGEDGTPFYVGNGLLLHASTSGELYLGVNDDQLGDNSGSWTAVVSSPGATEPTMKEPPTTDQAAALSPATKKLIAEEVQRQLEAEQAAAANPQQMEADPAAAPGALDPNERVFVVYSALNETADGQECGLSAGDVITRRRPDTPDANQNVNVLVDSSKSGDCSAGTEFVIAVQDLQDMHNHFQEQIDAGMDELKKNQGKNHMPAADGANVARTEVADGQAKPDPNAEGELQQQEAQANQTEQQITQEVSTVTTQSDSLPVTTPVESPSLASAPAASLPEQLAAQYKLARIGSDSSGYSVVQEGTLLAIQKGGILGVPYSDSTVLSTKYEGGTVKPPNSLLVQGRKSIFGYFSQTQSQGQTTHLFAVGDKVYPSKIEVNLSKDSVTMGIVACDTCNKTDPPTYNKAQVVFKFPNGSLAKASASEVEDTIGQLLAISTDDTQQGQAAQ